MWQKKYVRIHSPHKRVGKKTPDDLQLSARFWIVDTMDTLLFHEATGENLKMTVKGHMVGHMIIITWWMCSASGLQSYYTYILNMYFFSSSISTYSREYVIWDAANPMSAHLTCKMNEFLHFWKSSIRFKCNLIAVFLAVCETDVLIQEHGTICGYRPYLQWETCQINYKAS